MQFIDLKTQYQHLKTEIKQGIDTVLEHGQYIMGPEVTTMEQLLADYVGVKHCLGVASGTDAILMALMALDIKAGDEIITTPFTFFATAEMIVLLGAKPVFVDIDPKTYNIDPRLIEQAITDKTKAIMPVSLYGQCADMDTINAIANKYGIAVIEDAAQSFGANYKNKKSGGLSSIGVTSFFPSKPLGCYGDGGACFTNDDQLAEKMRWIRIHGQDRRYHHPVIGINGRLDTIQAAIIIAKMKIFPQEVEQREQIGARYTDLLLNKVVTPYLAPYNTHVYAQYTVQVEQRNSVQEYLQAQGIPTAVHYPIPLNLQPVFAYLGQPKGSFPLAEYAAERVLSLPMHPYLTLQEQQQICNGLLKCLAQQQVSG
ncbi:MAG: aminotransferase DegT [Gammaproteobacteria bacterium]|nr:aminotransferase DegT [Gammaproteobacteria bacterium]